MIGDLDFEKLGGLIPAVVQESATGRVLMLGFMSRESLALTLADGLVTFWSRSRNRLWRKGESSGNFLRVDSIAADCDGDALLLRVTPDGPVCHTGSRSCFGGSEGGILARLEDLIGERRRAPAEGSYTASLFREGLPRIAQKVGEEGVEVVIASLLGDDERLKEEGADLVYHLLVLLAERGLSLGDILAVLERRMAPGRAALPSEVGVACAETTSPVKT
jgi:phosphoribosyl-ATP pyrophosphohydrolase/phosphoribosyl-AMP cyclohydrolase